MIPVRARLLVAVCMLLWLEIGARAEPLPSSSPPGAVTRLKPPPAPLSPASTGYRLYHHQPERDRQRPAVVMVPGFGFNARLFDLSPEISLANALVHRGYPVWRFEPDWAALSEDAPTGSSLSWLVRSVLPSALAEVRRAEGGRPIVLIGHGTGASLVAGYLGGEPDAAISAAVFIAPVLSLRYPDRALSQLRLDERLREGMLSPAPLLLEPSPFPGGGDYFGLLLTGLKPEHQVSLRTLAATTLAPLPGRTAQELLEWVRQGCCPAGDLDFFQSLPRLRLPVLLISGIADNIARREDVERAALYIGSEDREYRMMSRTNLYRHDYGHLDLIASPEAAREVYPYVWRWIEGHRSRAPLPRP